MKWRGFWAGVESGVGGQRSAVAAVGSREARTPIADAADEPRLRRGIRRAPRRRPLPSRHDRRRRPEEAARAAHRGPGRRHGASDDRRRDSERSGLGRRHAAIDLVGHSPPAARADSRPSFDARVREQPPARRTARRARSTNWRARRSCDRITGRSPASSARRSKTC